MSIKLNDAQMQLLADAARREDHILDLPSGAKRARARRAASMLLEASLVKEAKAKKNESVWRRDEQSGHTFALKLTAAGRKAIFVNHDDTVKRPANGTRSSPTILDQSDPSAVSPDRSPTETMRGDEAVSTAAPLIAPRAGSKIAGVIARLSQPEGATIVELTGATGWLPHTTRAALTGLRKRGYTLTLDRSNRTQGSIYRLLTESGTRQTRETLSGKEEGGRQEADGREQKGEGGSREDETASSAAHAMDMSVSKPERRRNRKNS